MEDKQLIKACIKGDPRAQRELYERYGPLLMGLCMRYAGNREDAEEIFHDAMLRIFKNLHKFDQRSKLSTWMSRIGINSAIDFIRKRKNVLMVEHLSSDIQDMRDDADVEEEVYLEADVAMGLLKSLPENQQVIINMHLIDELSHREIAQQLDISEEASRSKLSRAKRTLVKLVNNKLKKNESDQQSI